MNLLWMILVSILSAWGYAAAIRCHFLQKQINELKEKLESNPSLSKENDNG